jgi:hypothetical protein
MIFKFFYRHNLLQSLKAWHIYIQALQGGKGRWNIVLKLTADKDSYIIREKTNNISSKIIAED